MRMALLVWGFIIIAGSSNTIGQKVVLIDKPELGDLVHPESDTVYVVNFWATWCSPCVKELEFFQELHDEYANKAVRVRLINLDFPNQVEKRVIPFLKDKEITAEVYTMKNMDYNSWIPLVDNDWSGAIPATLIISNTRRHFIPKEITRSELFSLVNETLEN